MAQEKGNLSINSENFLPIIKKWLYTDKDIFVRELVSKIQTMRKEAGFEVLDRIKVYYSGNDKIGKIFADNKESISTDVLANDICEGTSEINKEWNINGEMVTLSVEKM